MYSRYIALAVFIVLLLLITFRDKSSWKKKLSYYGMTFIEGMVGGFIIDCIGINAGYYHFPRQPFLSLQYFAIVIPCWGVFGLFINCLWKWVGKEKFIKGMAMTLPFMFAFYEGSNLITGSWVYTAPLWSVCLGWVPLIWVFAGCNRRRKVVFKIEYLRNTCRNRIYSHVLAGVRILLVILMFPILFTSLYKLIVNLPKFRAANFTTQDYLKYMMVA